MDRIVFEYAPIIYMDKKEPFKVRKVGFAEYCEDGATSFSFNRRFDLKNFEGAMRVLEYIYYLDYDIQHLYDLEHIWIYVDGNGKIVGAEGSFHGRFLNAMNRTFGEAVIRDEKRIVMYSQPGKHAFLSDPRLMYLYSELFSSCDRLAGISGLDAPLRFIEDIDLSDGDNEKVVKYIKEHFRFVPSMEFEEISIPECDYMAWEELSGKITGYIREELSKIL